jgi:hypothetical protein
MLSKTKARVLTDRQVTAEKTQSVGGSRQQAASEEELFQRIQIHAYYLWENAGRPEGEEYKEHFWSEAEKQVSLGR